MLSAFWRVMSLFVVRLSGVWWGVSGNEVDKVGKGQLTKGLECHAKEWRICLLAMGKHQEPILKCSVTHSK